MCRNGKEYSETWKWIRICITSFHLTEILVTSLRCLTRFHVDGIVATSNSILPCLPWRQVSRMNIISIVMSWSSKSMLRKPNLAKTSVQFDWRRMAHLRRYRFQFCEEILRNRLDIKNRQLNRQRLRKRARHAGERKNELKIQLFHYRTKSVENFWSCSMFMNGLHWIRWVTQLNCYNATPNVRFFSLNCLFAPLNWIASHFPQDTLLV